MRTFSIAAMALCATVALGAGAANAQPASPDTCHASDMQVKTALDANQSSANYREAFKERGLGRDFCNNAMYKVGMNHYAQALKLLGAS